MSCIVEERVIHDVRYIVIRLPKPSPKAVAPSLEELLKQPPPAELVERYEAVGRELETVAASISALENAFRDPQKQWDREEWEKAKIEMRILTTRGTELRRLLESLTHRGDSERRLKGEANKRWEEAKTAITQAVESMLQEYVDAKAYSEAVNRIGR